MQVLESRHKSELSAHYKSQERELEQLKTSYEREIERLRSRQRAEMEQRLKYEGSEERKFEKSLRDKRDTEMKRFLGQQKADYRATKILYKTVSASIQEHIVYSSLVTLHRKGLRVSVKSFTS